jgi:hypothetical protein
MAGTDGNPMQIEARHGAAGAPGFTRLRRPVFWRGKDLRWRLSPCGSGR